MNTLFPDPVRFPLHGEAPFRGALRHDRAQHVGTFGDRMTARDTDGDELIARVQAAELTGRGGAHFCAATKWRAVRATNQQAVVVVNAAESEPASVKDAALLQLRPHLVLDGVAAAAEATNATEVIVWLHQGSHNTRDSLNQALSERRQAGVVDPEIRFAYGPARYLSGESSAIINALSGGPTLPMFRRRPSSQSGVNERPTLLHNVETFARVGALARTTVRHPVPGTMLTVVSSHGRTVVDVPPNWTLSDAVHHATSFALADVPLTAVLVGGYGGQWIPWPEAQTLPLCEPLTRARGRSLGAGVVAVLPAFTCGVAESARILRYLADSSARQCGPCLFGLAELAALMDRVACGDGRRADLKRLDRFADQVRGRGGCHHPDGAVRMLASCLEVFARDLESHVRRKRCLIAQSRPFLPVPEAA